MPKFIAFPPERGSVVEDNGQAPKFYNIELTTRWRVVSTIDNEIVGFFDSEEEARARAAYLNEP